MKLRQNCFGGFRHVKRLHRVKHSTVRRPIILNPHVLYSAQCVQQARFSSSTSELREFPSVLDELHARGFVNQVTHEDKLRDQLSKSNSVLYAGFDPTADSLHLGNLVVLMAMLHFRRYGHHPLCLVGGATGMIGDPSGQSKDRTMLTEAQIQTNMTGIQAALNRIMQISGDNDEAASPPAILNNLEWYKDMSLIDYLRRFGSQFRLSTMLNKESVKGRLDSEAGMSFLEFSYSTLQSVDFLHLYENHGCTIQIGGSDQFGNITLGIDLVRKEKGGSVYGLTVPLLTTASGDKFGKSAGNALWIDPAKTSPFHLYQYFLQCEDADVGRFLKLFTLLPVKKIDDIVEEHRQLPEARHGQRLLAEQITSMIHGQEALDSAIRCTKALFEDSKNPNGTLTALSTQEILTVFENMPQVTLDQGETLRGMSIVAALVKANVASSKGEARRLIKGGGIYLNNERVSQQDIKTPLQDSNILQSAFCIFRKGKKNYFLLRES